MPVSSGIFPNPSCIRSFFQTPTTTPYSTQFVAGSGLGLVPHCVISFCTPIDAGLAEISTSFPVLLLHRPPTNSSWLPFPTDRFGTRHVPCPMLTVRGRIVGWTIRAPYLPFQPPPKISRRCGWPQSESEQRPRHGSPMLSTASLHLFHDDGFSSLHAFISSLLHGPDRLSKRQLCPKVAVGECNETNASLLLSRKPAFDHSRSFRQQPWVI